MIPQIKIKSNRSMDKQDSNLYEQDCDIYDKNKYGNINYSYVLR